MGYELPLTAAEYSPNLCMLRKAIVMDRSARNSEVIVSDGLGKSVTLFLRHSDLYVTGLDFGSGPFHFLSEAPGGASRALEFEGSYGELGLHGGDLVLDASRLTGTVSELAGHQVGPKGSNFFAEKKRALMRLLFAVPEALRFWTIHQAVNALLQAPGTSLRINDFAGHDKPLNNWDRWSRRSDWPAQGVFVPSLKS